MYRKLAGAESETAIDDWREELEDRFGAIPDAAKNLITVAKIKLFAARNLFTKVTIRSDRMWLVCPKQKSEIGVEFYENRFQPLLKKLQEQASDRLKVVQKKNRVRFVIQDIPDLNAAANFLNIILPQQTKEKAIA